MGCFTEDWYASALPAEMQDAAERAHHLAPRALGPAAFAAIGARVRRLRLEAGWTQEEIGRPFSKGYVSQIEQGKVAPSLSLLCVIATRLGTSVKRLAPELDNSYRLEDVTRLWEAARRLGLHGEQESELDMLEQASRVAGASESSALHGQSLLRYADALRRAGHTEDALQATTDALEVYGREGSSRLLGQCYVTAAMAYRDRGDLVSARSSLERALRHTAQRDRVHSRARIELGRILLRSGMAEEAAESAGQAAGICRQYGDGRDEAAARLLLAEIRLAQGRLREAQVELDNVRPLAQGLADERLALRLSTLAGLVRLAAHDDAEEAEECLAAARSAGDDALCVLSCLGLVDQRLARGDAEASVRFAAIGIEHARRARDWERLAELMARQAIACATDGRPGCAAEALLHCRETYMALHMPDALRTALREVEARLGNTAPDLQALLTAPPAI